MALPSFHCSNERAICIDPQLLVYESGRGVHEPRYMPTQAADHEAIDLYASTNTQEHPVQAYQTSTSNPYQYFVLNEAGEHESISSRPSWPLASSLDPKASVFVPASLVEENYNICNEGFPGFDPLRPIESPPAPRIKVSGPGDVRSTGGRRVSGGARRKSRSHSRQSSQGSRSSSISRPRTQSKSRNTPAIPTALTAKLLNVLTTAPTSSVAHVPLGLADHSTPWTGLDNSYQIYPHPSLQHSMTVGPSIHGYRCDHEGCPESAKVWDTRSDRDHHLRKHVPEDQRAHACVQCGRKFHFPKDVKRHQDTHNKFAGVTCPLCGKFYSRPDNLKRHISTLHKDTPILASNSQTAANSPDHSRSTSCVQSPVDTRGHYPPWMLGPLMAKSTPSSQAGQYRHDSVVEPNKFDNHETSESSLCAQPMAKSYSNGI